MPFSASRNCRVYLKQIRRESFDSYIMKGILIWLLIFMIFRYPSTLIHLVQQSLTRDIKDKIFRHYYSALDNIWSNSEVKEEWTYHNARFQLWGNIHFLLNVYKGEGTLTFLEFTSEEAWCKTTSIRKHDYPLSILSNISISAWMWQPRFVCKHRMLQRVNAILFDYA